MNCSGSAPLTTKGDLLGFDTANVRIPVGADGTFLEADSTQTKGVKWGTPTSGGGGVQYPNPPAFAFFGDSLGMVSTTNSTSSLSTQTATAAACDGVHCNITDATGVGAGFYRVGQWLLPGTDNLSGFSPACLAYSRGQVTSIVGNQVFWSETAISSQVPGHGSSQGGCSGTVSGTGGPIQDATYFFPYQAGSLPYFTQGGTVTPVIVNRHWPGQQIADLDTNWSSYSSGVPSGSWVFVLTNDVCTSNNPVTIIGSIKSILTKIHTAGQKAIWMTIPNGPTFDCGLGTDANATAVAVNNWVATALCGTPINPAASSACADAVIDLATYGANDRNNTALLVEPFIQTNQSGSLGGHYTNAGNILTAQAVQQALVNAGSNTSSGLAGIHAANAFSQINTFAAGFNLSSTQWRSSVISGGLQDYINGLGVYRTPYNYFQYLQRASQCWSENDTGTGGDYASAPGGGCFSEAFQGSANGIYSHKIAVGQGVFPSNTTVPTAGDASGGLVFQDFILHGRSSDPTCSNLLTTDGMLWYNNTTFSINSCQNGAVVTWAVATSQFPAQAYVTLGVSGVTTLTASPTPTAASFLLFKNGSVLKPGSDWTISGASVSLASSGSSGDTFVGQWQSSTNSSGSLTGSTPSGYTHGFDQSQSAGSGGATTSGQTASITLTTGDLIVQWCNSAVNGATYTATNSTSMSYSGNSSNVGASGWGSGEMFYILSATSGSATFGCNTSGSATFLAVGVMTFHRSGTNLLVTSSDGSTNSCSGTSCTTAAFTNLGVGVAIMCGKVPGSSGTTTATVGGNTATAGAAGGSGPGCYYYINSAALTGATDTFTNTNTFASWGINALAFK